MSQQLLRASHMWLSVIFIMKSPNPSEAEQKISWLNFTIGILIAPGKQNCGALIHACSEHIQT